MRSTRVPIDNCPHGNIEYDEIAEHEYCAQCGLIFENKDEGWLDPTNM